MLVAVLPVFETDGAYATETFDPRSVWVSVGIGTAFQLFDGFWIRRTPNHADDKTETDRWRWIDGTRERHPSEMPGFEIFEDLIGNRPLHTLGDYHLVGPGVRHNFEDYKSPMIVPWRHIPACPRTLTELATLMLKRKIFGVAFADNDDPAGWAAVTIEQIPPRIMQLICANA